MPGKTFIEIQNQLCYSSDLHLLEQANQLKECDSIMRLGIDGSNLIGGGGLTHLVELLKVADPDRHSFEKIVIWSSGATLQKIVDRPWLKKSCEPELEKNLAYRLFWHKTKLNMLLSENSCDVLFVPGGTYSGSFRPYITMSRNMIPFERQEILRYGFSWQFMRNLLLRWSMTRAFRRADGLIFLADYARQRVMARLNKISGRCTIIPHGLDEGFFKAPRQQLAISKFSSGKPFRLLYVSLVDFYKHQWNVIAAVKTLKHAGLPICLDLIGPAYGPALKKMSSAIADADPEGNFIRYLGPIPYKELSSHYQKADLFVFASSCENLPNTLLEAMASGLPIACSSYGSMTEILGNAGLYFDPEVPDQIADSIKSFIESPDLRAQMANKAFAHARKFSWQRCADQTFEFLNGFSAKR